MKLRCPNCGHAAELVHFANEEAARHVVVLVAGLPKSIGPLSLRYIGLFKPTQRSLSWDRTFKLLRVLKVDIDAGRIERHARIWVVTEQDWVDAMTTTLERADIGKVKLPLKNHAYLYEILSSKANSAEAREEQKIEEKRQQAQHRITPVKQQPVQSKQDKAAGDSAMQQAFKQLGITRKHGEQHDSD